MRGATVGVYLSFWGEKRQSLSASPMKLLAILCGTYNYLDILRNLEAIVDWAAFIPILISVIALCLSVWGLVMRSTTTRIQKATNYNTAKINKALSYSLYASPHLREARRRIGNHLQDNLNRKSAVSMAEIEKLWGKKDDDCLQYGDVRGILAHWENMALAIHKDVADYDTAYEMVGGTLTTYVTVFRSFIDHTRSQNPRAYNYLIDLNRDWSDRLKNDGEKAPKNNGPLV